MPTRRIPLLVWLLLAADATLALMPLVLHLAGAPYPRLLNFFDVDREASLPTWYSSMQWFCAGVLFGLLPLYSWRQHLPGLLPMTGLALTCLLFSADEVAGMHEWLGKTSDALLPGGDRHETALARTGLWPLLIGIPVTVVLAVMVYRMRRAFAPAPRALRLLVVGLAVMFAGALLVESAMNLIPEGPEEARLLLLQHSAEEFLEMLGVTFISWSAYALLAAYGFELRAPADFHEPRASRSRAVERRSGGVTIAGHRSSLTMTTTASERSEYDSRPGDVEESSIARSRSARPDGAASGHSRH